MSRILSLDAKAFNAVTDALRLKRRMAEDFFHDAELLFGPQEEEPVTEEAWKKFQDTDNMLSDVINGKYDFIGEEERTDGTGE